MARGPRRVRRTKTVHRGTTIKHRDKFRPIVVRSGSHTGGPKKVRKAPQVHRPYKTPHIGDYVSQHGAAYGVSQGKAGRYTQQKFRHLTVKVARVLGYPMHVVPMRASEQGPPNRQGTGYDKKPPIRDGSVKDFGGRKGSWNRFSDYEKLALAIAEGKGLLK